MSAPTTLGGIRLRAAVLVSIALAGGWFACGWRGVAAAALAFIMGIEVGDTPPPSE